MYQHAILHFAGMYINYPATIVMTRESSTLLGTTRVSIKKFGTACVAAAMALFTYMVLVKVLKSVKAVKLLHLS